MDTEFEEEWKSHIVTHGPVYPKSTVYENAYKADLQDVIARQTEKNRKRTKALLKQVGSIIDKINKTK